MRSKALKAPGFPLSCGLMDKILSQLESLSLRLAHCLCASST
jgi:hypothetical protein